MDRAPTPSCPAKTCPDASCCPWTTSCKEQETQNLGLGKAGYFTSSKSAPVFHKYGALWVPSLKGTSGEYSQGYIEWFLDGQAVGKKVTFTGTPSTTELVPTGQWRYSIIDTDPLSTGSGSFMSVDYVAVWQRP